MLLKINYKKNIVNKFKKDLNKSVSIFLIGFKNISCNKLNNIRKEVRKINSFIFVLKNNLFKLSIKDTDISFINKYLINSNIICYSFGDIVNIIKLLNFYLIKYKKELFLKILLINKKKVKKRLINNIIKFNTFKKSLIYLLFILKNISVLRIINVLLYIKKKLS